MDKIFDYIKYLAGGIGAVAGAFLGGIDALIITLIAFVAVDYTTGVICAYIEKKVDSAVGAKGIAKKVLIFLLVGLSSLLDVNVLGGEAVIRTAVIFFYITNEGISILENTARLGLPVPEKLREALTQLNDNKEKVE